MPATVAVVSLGLTATGMALFGISVPAIALATGVVTGAATVAVVIVGGVSVATGAVAGFAAWGVAVGRHTGAVLGLGVGAVVLLASTMAALSGGWYPALWAAFGIGMTTVAATTVVARAWAPPSLSD